MSVFFGTDGLRGVAGTEVTPDVAYKCGNSLSQLLKGKGKILIGKDTRVSGDMIAFSVISGLLAGGVNVTFVGVCPSGAVAYLTEKLGFDFGIMITASHNSAEYNGIKIFSPKGEKMLDSDEEKVERGFIKSNIVSPLESGKMTFKSSLLYLYAEFIEKTGQKLYGMRIVLDCSNGATYKYAPKIFRRLGARVFLISAKEDGKNINNNCGSLHPEKLARKVVKLEADFGFAFDGDGDRLIAVDERGNILDGDGVLTALATAFKERGLLKKPEVVGTSQTNIGVEKTLSRRGIKLHRADVGDKYVHDMMIKNGLELGGEQSGHIIIQRYMRTGDGILTAVQLASSAKLLNKTASEIGEVHKFPQHNIDVIVKDKLRILGSEPLSNATLLVQQELAGSGRVLVRASGTEPKIRIMVESEQKSVSQNLAEYLAKIVREEEDKY